LVKLYLVTGFLGAGKTTFVKNFIRLLAPQKIHLVINEFGRVGVDGELLAEMGAVMDEINNGSIFCACRLDKFEEALANILAVPPDVVVVEASGLSDPTSVRRILKAPRFHDYQYMGAICLVDASNFHKVLHTARVCNKQLSVSDLILVNKTDLVAQEQVEEVVRTIHDRYPDMVIQLTRQGIVQPEWLDCLGRNMLLDDDGHRRDITLQHYTVPVNERMSTVQLEHFINMFAEDTYRIKGFVRLMDTLYLVDCIGVQVAISGWTGKTPETVGTLVILAGKGMNPRKSIRKAAEWYPGLIGKVM